MKILLKGINSRKKLKEGIDICCDIVKVSMGGNGNNVALYNGYTTDIINDGVSIAKEIKVEDETMQAGIQLAKQCAEQTDKDAGDGTTTTLVLLQSILNKVITDIQIANPRKLRAELFEQAERLLKAVKTKQIKNKKDIYNLALTSSLDERIATVLADAFNELGKDSKIAIEETTKDVLECEIVGGMQFDSKIAREKVLIGENKKIELENAGILVLDKKVEDLEHIQTAVGAEMDKGNKDLVVIAPGYSRQVLISFIVPGFNIHAIEFSELKTMEDIKIFAKNAKKVVITEETTTIIGGEADKEYVDKLRADLKKEESSYEREKLENRIANLTGGVASIKIGSKTDVHRTELVLKVEDAINAIKGAYEGGYAKGAGKALQEASEACSDTIAGEIMKEVAQSPYKQICSNYGEEIEVPDTVIDSFKSIKCSLMNALSTATSIMTVEAAVIKKLEKDD